MSTSPAPVDDDSPAFTPVTDDFAEPEPEEVKPEQKADDRTEDELVTDLLGARRIGLYVSERARLWAWLSPLLVGVLAAAVRFFKLGHPHKLVFDETYYVKQGYSLLRWGYELAWPEDANEHWVAGDLDVWLSRPEYIAHPPVGKWMIALGLAPDPANPFNWRLATAVVGVLACVLLVIVAQRILGSIPIAALVGVFMALDGQAIVHSRVSLLDNFLMFWVLVAFLLLIFDREQARRRLAAKIVEARERGHIDSWGPALGIRWYRIAAAVALGLAIGVKWSGLYFLAVFGLLTVAWDATARRRAGVRDWLAGAFFRDAVPAGLIMVPVAIVTYIATWAGWFANPNAFQRGYAAENPISYGPLPGFLHGAADALRSLWHFHTMLWDFHNGLSNEHPYMANAWGFPLQLRATSMHYESTTPGEDVCGAATCSEAITGIGNPAVWWLATAAMIFAIVALVRRFDWRAGAALSGILAGWVPWLLYPERTIYTFYTIAFLPWMCLCLGYAGVRLEEWADGDTRRKRIAWSIIGFVTLLVVAAFFYFLPIWTGMTIPYEDWLSRMWIRPANQSPLLGWI